MKMKIVTIHFYIVLEWVKKIIHQQNNNNKINFLNLNLHKLKFNLSEILFHNKQIINFDILFK